MTHKPDSFTAELPLGTRPRVRLPQTFAPARIFPGWGPGLER
jgi:hypothetical protein